MDKRALDIGALNRPQEAWLWTGAICTVALHAPFVPPWLIALATLAFTWRAYLWLAGLPLPSRPLVTLLALCAAGAVFAQFQTVFGRLPGVAMLVIFLALKLLEMRVVRDAWVAVLLCYFLIFSLFFESQSIPMAAAAMAAVLVVTAALAALYHAPWRISANLRLAATILVQAVPLTLAMFLLFPRIQGPLWGLPSDAHNARTGLSDTMSPGSIGHLVASDAIAFRVKFEGAVPPRSELYWRGPVLSSFDGETWRPAGSAQPAGADDRNQKGRRYDYTVTLEPHDRRWIFALELPVRLPQESALTSDYSVVANAPVHGRLRYEVSSRTGVQWGQRESDRTLLENLQLPPELDPQARALASTWRQSLSDDEEIVQAALRLFRREPFVYTLRPPLLEGDRIDKFLFETRRGFCEHYAGAFVFLMRAAGIPARVVTGYQGGETNPVDDYLTVRQSDAHAWAEVWLRATGWTRIDPTAAIAPSRVESGIGSAIDAAEPLPLMIRVDAPWARGLRYRWEAMANAWNQSVLGYNARRQREVLSRLGMQRPDWQNMAVALAILSGMLVAALLPWAARMSARPDPVVRSWETLSRKLAQLGLARYAWEGPLDYASRAARALPHQSKEIDSICTLYTAFRYASSPDPDLARQLKLEIKRFKPTRIPS